MGFLKVYTVILTIIVVALVIAFAVSYIKLSKSTATVSKDESLQEAESTLVMAHVLFRHGNRVPNGKAYSNNPIANESYYPEGYGQISEVGKKVAYRVGTNLHQRYDWFLGPTWNYQYTDARSTSATRTKMSLQLVLAGLWPPTGVQVIDPSLNWQPIPFNLPSTDKELSSDKICNNFKTMKRELENSVQILDALSVYRDFYLYLSNVTGDSVTTLQNAFDICMDQIAQRAYGYPLEDWVTAALPTLQKMAKDVYYIETNNTKLKSIAGGYLLKKIVTDSKAKMDGTISPKTRKMFLYSAHERNLAHFLLTLGVYDDKIPTYGAHILVELHLVGEVYGFKIFHQDWSTPEPKLLTIPGCQAFCAYDEFVSLLQEVIPADDYCVMS